MEIQVILVIQAKIKTLSNTEQKVNTSLERVVRLYELLVSFIDSLREMFPLYEQKARTRCNIDYETTCYKRQRKRKPQYDASKEQEVILDGKDKFRVETFYAVLDQLKSALDKRKTAYDLVVNNFSVFSDLSTQPADII